PPRFHALFDELAHRGYFGLGRGAVRGFVRKNADEAHAYPPGFKLPLPSTILSNGVAADRHRAECSSARRGAPGLADQATASGANFRRSRRFWNRRSPCRTLKRGSTPTVSSEGSRNSHARSSCSNAASLFSIPA